MYSRTNVIELTDNQYGMGRILHKDFNKLPNSEDKFGIVVFYSPKCPWCHRMKDDFIKAAKYANKIIAFGAVDATMSSNKNITKDFNVKHYPMIYIIKNGYKFKEYEDERTFKNFIQSVCSEVNNKYSIC